MGLIPKPILILFIVICVSIAAKSQDTLSATHKIVTLPKHFLTTVDNKTATLENKLTKQTEKYSTGERI